jgi:hypothetical protein
MNEKLFTLLWFLETALSVSAIVIGTLDLSSTTTITHDSNGGNIQHTSAGPLLTILGGIGLLASLIFGNTAPILIALLKYPVMLIWWLAVLFACTIGLAYGIFTLISKKEDIKHELENFNLLTALITSGACMASLLGVTLMIRSSINISKFVLLR